MSKKEKFNLEKHIANQAVNFDNLPWNRKERNFALFWPVITWGMVLTIFIAALTGKTESVPNSYMITLIIMTLTTPILYFAYKNYVWAFITIPVIYVCVAIYKIWTGTAENIGLPLLVITFFIIPIKVELYRMKHGLSPKKNVKKDIIIGIILALIFPALWLLSALWR